MCLKLYQIATSYILAFSVPNNPSRQLLSSLFACFPSVSVLKEPRSQLIPLCAFVMQIIEPLQLAVQPTRNFGLFLDC